MGKNDGGEDKREKRQDGPSTGRLEERGKRRREGENLLFLELITAVVIVCSIEFIRRQENLGFDVFVSSRAKAGNLRVR